MSLSSNELVRAVKVAAVDAVRAMKPMAFMYGEVISASPLSIQVSQRMTIHAKMLLLTSPVRDEVLAVGEKVMLIRCDGGGKYIILDRAEEAE